MILLLALGWLLVVNALTVLAFRTDKRIAVNGGGRITESDLLLLAFVGGSPGALFARHRFRHKTRKQPFSSQLLLIWMIQLGAVIGLTLF